MNLERDEAELIVDGAAQRALGERPRVRIVAIVLWSAFLGGALSFGAWLFEAVPLTYHDAGFAELTSRFLAFWAFALVPAVSAALLAAPPRSPDP